MAAGRDAHGKPCDDDLSQHTKPRQTRWIPVETRSWFQSVTQRSVLPPRTSPGPHCITHNLSCKRAANLQETYKTWSRAPVPTRLCPVLTQAPYHPAPQTGHQYWQLVLAVASFLSVGDVSCHPRVCTRKYASDMKGCLCQEVCAPGRECVIGSERVPGCEYAGKCVCRMWLCQKVSKYVWRRFLRYEHYLLTQSVWNNIFIIFFHLVPFYFAGVCVCAFPYFPLPWLYPSFLPSFLPPSIILTFICPSFLPSFFTSSWWTHQ